MEWTKLNGAMMRNNDLINSMKIKFMAWKFEWNVMLNVPPKLRNYKVLLEKKKQDVMKSRKRKMLRGEK